MQRTTYLRTLTIDDTRYGMYKGSGVSSTWYTVCVHQVQTRERGGHQYDDLVSCAYHRRVGLMYH